MLLQTESELSFWRSLRWNVVVATGCFDVLHVGHIRLLNYAKKQGTFLLVGINSDESVRKLKGEGRPINNQSDRAEALDALQCVNGVYVFDETTATRFLDMAMPSIWVKGGDYTMETLNHEERLAVQKHNGTIKLFRTIEGYSTTSTIQRANKAGSSCCRNVDLPESVFRDKTPDGISIV